MGAGKYSPTVSSAYSMDRMWHKNLCAEDDWHDDEGYDSYGYHRDTERDRAGYTEWDYLSSGRWDDEDFSYPLYDNVYSEWRFDGVRPKKIG